MTPHQTNRTKVSLADFHHTISSIPVHTKSLSSNTGENFADIAYNFGGIYTGSISIRGTVITNFEGKFTSMHIYTLCYHHDVVRRESFGRPSLIQQNVTPCVPIRVADMPPSHSLMGMMQYT